MTCIHGFEEDCPLCRITAFSYPEKVKQQLEKNLEVNLPQIVKNATKGDSFHDILSPRIKNLDHLPFTILERPTPLTKPPKFRNKMFSERLSEINIIKSDYHGILKRIPLINPQLDLEDAK